MLLKHFFSLILICFVSQKVFSQKAFCDTIPFRGQTICLESYNLESLSLDFSNELYGDKKKKHIDIYRLGRYDSVVVKLDGVFFSTFLTKDITEVISRWIIYEDQGVTFVDSFYQAVGKKQAYGRGYFGLFGNKNHPFTTWNKMENSNKYYSCKGVDSASIFRYAGGATKEIDYWNGDRRLFYKSGKLHYKINISLDTIEYYSNGITAKMSVKHWDKKSKAINLRREYYTNGAIRSEAFYSKKNYYYYTSKFYAQDGKLRKKDYRKMPRSFPPQGYDLVAAPPMEDKIFLTVIQQSEYPGGWYAFQKRLKQLLYKIDGQGWDNLMFYGSYTVTANVDSAGNFTATNVKGYYAPDRFLKYMNETFSDIRWKPYNLVGKRCTVSYVFSIKVNGEIERPPNQY